MVTDPVMNGWEIVLTLSLVLILFGATKLPEIARGLREGASQFRKRVGALPKELDQEAPDPSNASDSLRPRAPNAPCQKPTNALPCSHGRWRIIQDPGTDVLPFPILPLNSIPILYAKACY